jgi:uncharacterized membrane protein
MTTLLLMLGLLAGPYAALLLVGRRPSRQPGAFRVAGCVGIALVFAFTAIGHFALTRQMSEMIPPVVKNREAIVMASGVIELLAAVAILIPRVRSIVGWGLIAMLLLFLPINAYAAVMRVPFGGHEWGPAYLLLRVPLQFVLIGWIWWFAIRPPAAEQAVPE